MPQFYVDIILLGLSTTHGFVSPLEVPLVSVHLRPLGNIEAHE